MNLEQFGRFIEANDKVIDERQEVEVKVQHMEDTFLVEEAVVDPRSGRITLIIRSAA